MAPRFKDGDFAGGMIATLNQLSSRLAASKDEGLHPKTTTNITQEAPTDLSWVWGLLIFGTLILGIWAIWKLFVSKTAKKEKISTSQSNAISQRNQAAQKLRKLQSDIEDVKATNTQTDRDIAIIQATVDSASEVFSDLSKSIKGDPNTPNLLFWEYDNIAGQYQTVCAQLDQASKELYLLTHPFTNPGSQAQAQPGTAGISSGSTQNQIKHKRHVSRSRDRDVARSTGVNNTVITGGGFPVPVFIPEPEPIYEAPTPTRDPDPTPEPDPEPSGGSSDYGSGGGDSGGDSSGGGSSDFGGGDSGGGDSGGGGGDSGGGSSDF